MARAAIVYLWQYERRAIRPCSTWRAALEFVRYMQAEDGAFYNSSMTAKGRSTSRQHQLQEPGLVGDARLWALGEGVRVFDGVDKAYADALAETYLDRTGPRRRNNDNVGATMTPMASESPPGCPAARRISAIGLLGLSRLLPRPAQPGYGGDDDALADAIARLRRADDRYPSARTPHGPTRRASGTTGARTCRTPWPRPGWRSTGPDWIASAAEEADTFLLRQLAFERFRNMGVVPDRIGQIAYGTNMLVQTYMALFRATRRAALRPVRRAGRELVLRQQHGRVPM